MPESQVSSTSPKTQQIQWGTLECLERRALSLKCCLEPIPACLPHPYNERFPRRLFSSSDRQTDGQTDCQGLPRLASQHAWVGLQRRPYCSELPSSGLGAAFAGDCHQYRNPLHLVVCFVRPAEPQASEVACQGEGASFGQEQKSHSPVFIFPTYKFYISPN